MKAIILAAGRGSRMGRLTDNQPKCMTKLNGRMLIQWQLDAMHDAGIKEIAIVRGYCADAFQFKVKYFENKRWQETNMVMSLSAAGKWLQNDICIVSYSDIVYTKNIVKDLIKSEGDIVVSFDKNWLELWRNRFDNPLSDAETFMIDKDGILLDIGSCARTTEEIQGQYMGLLKLTPEGWCQVSDFLHGLPPHRRDKLDITTLLSMMISNGSVINTVPLNGWWCEIDSGHDLTVAEKVIDGIDILQ